MKKKMFYISNHDYQQLIEGGKLRGSLQVETQKDDELQRRGFAPKISTAVCERKGKKLPTN